MLKNNDDRVEWNNLVKIKSGVINQNVIGHTNILNLW